MELNSSMGLDWAHSTFKGPMEASPKSEPNLISGLRHFVVNFQVPKWPKRQNLVFKFKWAWKWSLSCNHQCLHLRQRQCERAFTSPTNSSGGFRPIGHSSQWPFRNKLSVCCVPLSLWGHPDSSSWAKGVWYLPQQWAETIEIWYLR